VRVLDLFDFGDAIDITQNVEQAVEEEVAQDVFGRHAEGVDVGARGVHAQLLGAEGEDLGGRLVQLLGVGEVDGLRLLAHPVLHDALQIG